MQREKKSLNIWLDVLYEKQEYNMAELVTNMVNIWLDSCELILIL
jgi:hypothetical protein